MKNILLSTFCCVNGLTMIESINTLEALKVINNFFVKARSLKTHIQGINKN